MKKIVLVIIIGSIAFGGYQLFKKEEQDFALFEVIRGDIVQELWETGRVQRGERINLSFKSAGEIEKIYIQTNQVVEKGEPLVKLNTRDPQVQLKEAEAAAAAYQAQLDKLLAGASKEEIQAVQTSVANAETALNKAKQSLENVEASAEESISAVYQDGLRALEVSYLNAYNAKIFIDLIQKTYFVVSDQEGIKVKEHQGRITGAVSEMKLHIGEIKSALEREKIDQALLQAEINLSVIYNSLGIIRDVCESPLYAGTVSGAHKTSLDTHRAAINTALTSIISARQAVSSAKITKNSNINAAETEVSLAEGNLQTAKDQLALILAPPREEDIRLYQAQVKQAVARVEGLENQIRDAVLRSPVKAQVVAINKREGEMVQVAIQDAVVSLLPAISFEITADIYEANIIRIKVGDPAEITLPAFPQKIFAGKVIFIDEAEKIIDGVVYYEIKIAFDQEPPEGIRPTMTADIIIQTEVKENVMVVPREAVKRVGEKTMAEVLQDGEIKEREIEVGLRGDEMTEVLSGLKEGEKVIVR